MTCFSPYVAQKLAASALARSVMRLRTRAMSPAEAERSIVQDAFAAMAERNQRHPLQALSLGAVLEYLWICAENLMRMELRRPPSAALSEEVVSKDDPVQEAEHRDVIARAAVVLRGCARDERDFQAGRLLIFLQYTPEELVAAEQFRHTFPDQMELYRIKARLLRCLREHFGQRASA
jgi:hypothetical protein